MSDLNPLNGRKTELIWEGKYDEAGRRVVPLRVVLPFQMVETVNETAQERQKSLSLFETPGGSGVGEWRNRLVWGDKKYVLPSLLAEFAGKVNLIYIDPPFDTGADFSFTATVPDHADTRPIAIRGGAAKSPTFNGSMKLPCCSMNYFTRQEASMCM